MNAQSVVVCALVSSFLGCGSKEPEPKSPPATLAVRDSRIPHDLGGPRPNPSAAALAAASAQPTPAASQPAYSVAKLAGTDVLGFGDRIAAMAAAPVGARLALAFATYVPPAMDKEGAGKDRKRTRKRSEGVRAKVLVRLLGSGEHAVSAPVVLSTSAEPVGGVAAAAGQGGRGEACFAWVEGDGVTTQLGFALLGEDGQVRARRVQTGGRLRASDVALAPSEDGWVALWIDQREGEPQVYASRVGRDLKVSPPERRLSHLGGEPSEVQLVALPGALLAAWSVSSSSGADVRTVTLSGPDLRAGEEVSLGVSAASVRGVRLDVAGDRAVVGWLEQTTAAAVPSARLRSLDLFGRPLGPTHAVAGSDGATSLALRCRAGSCRVVVGKSQGATATLELGALVWQPSFAPNPVFPLTSFAGVAPEDASPVLYDDAFFFAEDNLKGEGRLRRLRIAWP